MFVHFRSDHLVEDIRYGPREGHAQKTTVASSFACSSNVAFRAVAVLSKNQFVSPEPYNAKGPRQKLQGISERLALLREFLQRTGREAFLRNLNFRFFRALATSYGMLFGKGPRAAVGRPPRRQRIAALEGNARMLARLLPSSV